MEKMTLFLKQYIKTYKINEYTTLEFLVLSTFLYTN